MRQRPSVLRAHGPAGKRLIGVPLELKPLKKTGILILAVAARLIRGQVLWFKPSGTDDGAVYTALVDLPQLSWFLHHRDSSQSLNSWARATLFLISDDWYAGLEAGICHYGFAGKLRRDKGFGLSLILDAYA